MVAQRNFGVTTNRRASMGERDYTLYHLFSKDRWLWNYHMPIALSCITKQAAMLFLKNIIKYCGTNKYH